MSRISRYITSVATEDWYKIEVIGKWLGDSYFTSVSLHCHSPLYRMFSTPVASPQPKSCTGRVRKHQRVNTERTRLEAVSKRPTAGLTETETDTHKRYTFCLFSWCRCRSLKWCQHYRDCRYHRGWNRTTRRAAYHRCRRHWVVVVVTSAIPKFAHAMKMLGMCTTGVLRRTIHCQTLFWSTFHNWGHSCVHEYIQRTISVWL